MLHVAVTEACTAVTAALEEVLDVAVTEAYTAVTSAVEEFI